MAQTVSIQRGEITMTHNTTSLLFTSTASGTASRVIPGYLSWIASGGTVAGHGSIGILRSGEVSPNFVLIAASYPSTLARTMSYSPHDTATGWGSISGVNTANSPILVNPNNAGPIQSQSMFQSGSGANMAWFNKYIVVGPSDAFYCGWFDNSGSARSAVFQYCFTFITES